MLWLWLIIVSIIVIVVLYIRRRKPEIFKLPSRQSRDNISAQLGMLEERTRYLESLEERIERI